MIMKIKETINIIIKILLRMIKKLVCLIKGHEWGFRVLMECAVDICEYKKCRRCGMISKNDKKLLDAWIAG